MSVQRYIAIHGENKVELLERLKQALDDDAISEPNENEMYEIVFGICDRVELEDEPIYMEISCVDPLEEEGASLRWPSQ